MDITPITTEEQYDKMLEWVDKQFDNSPCIHTNEGADLQTALLLIQAYEDAYFPINLQNSRS